MQPWLYWTYYTAQMASAACMVSARRRFRYVPSSRAVPLSGTQVSKNGLCSSRSCLPREPHTVPV